MTECIFALKAILNLFLFYVTGMTSELLPGERVTIEMVHLLNIHAVVLVILTHVTVAALKPNHLTILPQMFSHFIICRFKITTAFE